MKLLTKILFTALLAFFPVYGTLVPQLSFEELVEQSESVAHGKVVSVRVDWDAERTTIWTYYEVQIEDALKGAPGAVLTVQEPGGELEGTVMEIVGAPRYQPGEEVVVFAARTPFGLRTCGWGQGRFVVEGEPGRKRVRNDLGDVQLTTPAGVPARARAAVAADEGLAIFKQRIRSEAARQAAARR